VSGVIGSEEATPLGASEMFAALAELRSRVHVGPDDEKYRLYLYRDVLTETYRYFQSCTTVRLETDVSNPTAFAYRLVMHADDPALYAE
jgi:hypothetical protein